MCFFGLLVCFFAVWLLIDCLFVCSLHCFHFILAYFFFFLDGHLVDCLCICVCVTCIWWRFFFGLFVCLSSSSSLLLTSSFQLLSAATVAVAINVGGGYSVQISFVLSKNLFMTCHAFMIFT